MHNEASYKDGLLLIPPFCVGLYTLANIFYSVTRTVVSFYMQKI